MSLLQHTLHPLALICRILYGQTQWHDSVELAGVRQRIPKYCRDDWRKRKTAPLPHTQAAEALRAGLQRKNQIAMQHELLQ
jgi:hypothetical protein